MQEATNSFQDGMNLDIPSMQFPNSAYSAALNATYTTGDGNEGVIQNDMGNAQILYNSTPVKLNPGFIPLGVKEYGGILYIASYKIIDGQCEIGTFPSPDYTKREGKLLNTYQPLHNLQKNGHLDYFTTKKLNFDINHHINIDVEASYDGSVNLILSDNKNQPRLINSMFAVYEGQTYKLTTHYGDNNTNIYNEDVFDISLQKQSKTLPKINYIGLENNGQLQVGGYVFYIKGSDEDGNTTDIIGESGIIPVFFGTDGVAKSINGGYADMRTDKAIHLQVYNMDRSYTHLKLYFSRTSSAINESANTTCYAVSELYPLTELSNKSWGAEIILTGFEQLETEIDPSEINQDYFIIDKNRTQTTHQNITFIGNVKGAEEDYDTLQKLSLHIYPILNTSSFINLTGTKPINVNDYSGEGYYKSTNVYNYVGYHNRELYRFGIVYIYANGSKSNVFNILGRNELSNKEDLWLKNISCESEIILQDNHYIKSIGGINVSRINRRGVCRINSDSNNPWDINGIDFKFIDGVKEKLSELGIIGYFFVRQKRIPLRLMQAFCTPIFENTFTPAIKWGASIKSYFGQGIQSNDIKFPSTPATKHTYIFESFFNAAYDIPYDDFSIGDNTYNSDAIFPIKALKHSIGNNLANCGDSKNSNQSEIRYKLYQDYNTRLTATLDQGLVFSKKTNEHNEEETNYVSINGEYSTYNGAYLTGRGKQPVTDLLEKGAYALFSPEYQLDQPYYNSLFTGQEFKIKINRTFEKLKRSSVSDRIYCAINGQPSNSSTLKSAKLIGVADGVSLLGIQRTNNNKNTESYKFRDTVYFSSKIGDATDKLGFKEVGGERVYTFSPPMIKECTLTQDDDQYTTNDKILIHSDGANSKKIERLEASQNFYSKRYTFLPFNEINYPTNLVRGLYSPYIGMYIENDSKDLENSLLDIYIPGFDEANFTNYRLVRMQDNSTYYTISDYYTLDENLNTCYRGDCYASIYTQRINRNFQDTTSPANDKIISETGFLRDNDEKVIAYYDTNFLKVNKAVTETVDGDNNKLKTNTTNLGDINAVQLGSWISFPLVTTMNIAYRSEDRSWATEKLQMGQYRSFYPLYGVNISGGGKIPDSTVYNKGFSISGGIKTYTSNDSIQDIYSNNYYKNRIYYSNINVDKGILNGSRIIKATHFRDYDSKYGAIVKLLNGGDSLICVMEHAVAKIGVMPRNLITEGTAGIAYLNTSNILDDRLTLMSDKFGSTWETSIVETPYGIYGVDTFAKKIWAIINGRFQIISDSNIETFLNDNLNIINEELHIGKVAIKTHYNLGKNDVIFTCYQYKENKNTNVMWSICYNELKQKFITFYSWIPEESANIGNSFITFDHQTVRKHVLVQSDILNSGVYYNNNKLYTKWQGEFNKSNFAPVETIISKLDNTYGNYLWKHGPSNFIADTTEILPTTWYGQTRPFEIEIIVAENPNQHKIFSNLKIIGNKAEPESFHYYIVGQAYNNSIDKPNQYYRQERTKELFHKAGSDIKYDPNYKELHIQHRPLWHYENEKLTISNQDVYVKSQIPWNYYARYQNPEEIENYYKLATASNVNYAYLTGTELVKDKRLQEIGFWSHAKGTNIDGPGGVLRGNMRYVEDRWNIQINPIFYKEKNEETWIVPPIVINNSPIPNDLNIQKLNEAAAAMGLSNRDFDFTDWGERKSFKLRDRYIKIRIRYSGKDKTIIQAIKTLYQLSYA